MLYDDLSGIVRVLVITPVAYAALVASLRVTGNRTLSKLNAFDLVVTVALGSTLATVILSDSVALAEGLLALWLLVGLQFVVTWLQVRSTAFNRLVRSEATLLVRDGRILEDAAQHARVSFAEIEQAVRQQGYDGAAAVGALVLESDGSFSVIASR